MSTSSRYSPDLQRPPYTIDLNEGHQQEQLFHDHHQLLLRHHSTTPVSFSRLQSFSRDQIGYLYMGSQLQPSPYHQEADNFSLYESGSCDRKALEIDKGANYASLKFTLCKKEDRVMVSDNGGGSGGGAEISGSSVNWPTPLRVMKEVMRGDDLQKDQLPPVQVQAETRHLIRDPLIGGSSNIRSSCNNNDNTSIRVCSDCNTTKTPLWRSGPRGPKSLCNACGIRQRKARRAMALATNGSLIPNGMLGSTMRVGNGHKKAPNNNNNSNIGAPKKRSKIVKPSREHQQNGAQRKLCLEEFALNLSKKLSLQQVFPQEEKEAAILLMALSCGLVHG